MIFRRATVVAVLAALIASGCGRAEPTGTEFGDIDTSGAPLQSPYSSDETFTIDVEDGQFILKPVASYSVSALVAGRKNYYLEGWKSELAPTDLALVWGDLAEPEYDQHITYSQSSRWYYFRYKSSAPFNEPFITRHSSNHHIIPATENIKKAVKSIKEKQRVVLEGFLVNIDGTYKGRDYWWNSSLSRNDTGNGSCEVFYVSRVRIGTDVYQ